MSANKCLGEAIAECGATSSATPKGLEDNRSRLAELNDSPEQSASIATRSYTGGNRLRRVAAAGNAKAWGNADSVPGIVPVYIEDDSVAAKSPGFVPVYISDEETVFVETVPGKEKKKGDNEGGFLMSVKTNLLYDVALVPNLGVEFHLGKRWSIALNGAYAWWSNGKRHRFWRIYGADINIRKWFGPQSKKQALTGHHLGIYGQVFTYDFEFGKKGQIGGKPGKVLWDEPNYAAGIEYGYSLPIGTRLNLDFTIGVGYWGGKYYKYIPLDGHYVWQETVNRHWIGPTKAEISLVWLIGAGYKK